MLRLLPFLLLLAACGGTTYSVEDDAKDTCQGLGHTGDALTRCIERRKHEEACRQAENARGSAEERRRRKAELRCE